MLAKWRTWMVGIVLAMAVAPAMAQWVVTNPISDYLRGMEAAKQYAQMALQYQQAMMQYDTMIQNLKTNGNITMPNLDQLAQNQARLMGMGKDISSGMSRVDSNFATTFKDPQAATFSEKFALWSNSSTDALRASMLRAGLQREQFPNDTAALQQMTRSVASADGNLAALQALGSLNAAQVQESMKLRDLIADNQVAMNTQLVAQTKKDQERQANTDLFTKPYTESIPTVGADKAQVINWKFSK